MDNLYQKIEVVLEKTGKAVVDWITMFYGLHFIYLLTMIFHMTTIAQHVTLSYIALLIAFFLMTLFVQKELHFASNCLDLAIDTEDDLDRANVFRRRLETVIKHYITVINSLNEESSPKFKDNEIRLRVINDMLINIAVDEGFLVETKHIISNEQLDELRVIRRQGRKV